MVVFIKLHLYICSMLEKEIKILEVDTFTAVKKLLEFWAKNTFDGNIIDTYYDFEQRVHKKYEEAQKIYRLRQKWAKSIYTVKDKKTQESIDQGVTIKEEIETGIEDPEKFAKILTMQWMIPIRKKQKHRISFQIDDVAFDFDTYEWIPTCLEIEWPDSETIFHWVEKLFLHKKEQLVGWSRVLFHRYNKPYTYCN